MVRIEYIEYNVLETTGILLEVVVNKIVHLGPPLSLQRAIVKILW